MADEPVQRKLLGAHLRRMARYVPPGARVLEVGCAYGYFLDLLRREYPAPSGWMSRLTPWPQRATVGWMHGKGTSWR